MGLTDQCLDISPHFPWLVDRYRGEIFLDCLGVYTTILGAPVLEV